MPKKRVFCPICGREIFSGKIGSEIEIKCLNCKTDLFVDLRDNEVVVSFLQKQKNA